MTGGEKGGGVDPRSSQWQSVFYWAVRLTDKPRPLGSERPSYRFIPFGSAPRNRLPGRVQSGVDGDDLAAAAADQ